MWDKNTETELRQLVKDSGVRLLEENLVQGTWGNISVRLDEDHMLVTPTGLDYYHLTPEDMFQCRFTGIRPAVGYPSLPDQSVNFLLDELTDFKAIGIRLTENGAMLPHGSVSGLMLAHPKATYFAVGKIGKDQFQDYVSRRGLDEARMRQFLRANL